MSWINWMIFFTLITFSKCSNIFMITIGGTRSHKIPFLALAKDLVKRNHTITFISPHISDGDGIPGIIEINPPGLVSYVKNYTNWDLVGARMRGEEPISFEDVLRYGYEACDALYSDEETKAFLASRMKFDVMLVDSTFPECPMGILHVMEMPFIYLNIVPIYMLEFSIAGNPAPYSITPFSTLPFTDDMNFVQRIENTFWNIVGEIFHTISMNRVRKVLRKHFPDMPDSKETVKNVSFMLQNGHYSVTYPRPYLPNIAEMGCIQCRPPKPLNKKLEDFINLGGDKGFIFISMGSSVKTDNMPEELKSILIKTLARLPYQILWKCDTEDVKDLPSNVMIQKWLPQQDLIGHEKIRVFVTHSGFLSAIESVYHGVPLVTIPVFCDQDSNAAKPVADGYGLKLDFMGLTSDILYDAIMRVAIEPSFKENAMIRSNLLKDDINTPMEKSLFWIEYVIRHNGAPVFFTPARNYNVLQYYSIDVFVVLFIGMLSILWFLKLLIAIQLRFFINHFKH